MSSISSISGSSTSSIYGSRGTNIISGLASGLDTESMIEGSVQGYKEKINSLLKKQTKLTWKQEKYRNITDKLVDISKKYTSYTSKTNLASNTFFNNAVKTTGSGANGDKIFATGRSSSDITINAVKSLATSARYQVGAGQNGSLIKTGASGDKASVLTGSAIDWSAPAEISNMTGSLTFGYDNYSIAIDFDESEIFKDTEAYVDENGNSVPAKTAAENLVDAINKKLEEQNVNIRGNTKASQCIQAKLSGGRIEFINNPDTGIGGTSPYIKSASGDLVEALGIQTGNKDNRSIKAPEEKDLYKTASMIEKISGQTVNVSLNGTTKSINVGDLANVKVTLDGTTYKAGEIKQEDLQNNKALQDKLNEAMNNAIVSNLQEGIDDAFGSGQVTVQSVGGALQFEIRPEYADGSSLSVSSSVNEQLGLGKSGLSNYVNTGASLVDLFGGTMPEGVNYAKSEDYDPNNAEWATKGLRDSNGNVIKEDGYYDSKGNLVDKDTGELIDEEGNRLYSLEINGVNIGNFKKDASLSSVMNAINSNSKAGVKVSYSKMANQFVFEAKQSGSGSQIAIEGGLAAALFGKTVPEDISDIKNIEGYTVGTDAVFDVTVNGVSKSLTRASNEVNIDGLTVTLKDTFNINGDEEEVHLDTKSDADTIIDAVKGFVEGINEVLKIAHDEYSTQPLKKTSSSSSRYEPLSEDEKADLSDKELERYEEKAKTGLLFADSNISGLYNKLRSAISSSGMDVKYLRDIGISTSYNDGVTSLELNEDKLRNALDTDPDKVRDLFTKTKENGADRDGIMASVSKVLNTYASTSIANPGILVRQAGTNKSSLSLMNNTFQKKMDQLDTEIDRWQEKMSDKIDYYSRQFTALEQLMSTMNNQSSMLSGMMGG